MNMSWFWRILFKGLVAVLPITVTIYLVYWLGITSEAFLGSIIKQFIPEEYYWSGMGTIVSLALVMLAGVLINNRVGQFFIRQLDYVITHVPIANTIYNAVLDLMQFFASSGSKEGMDQVVEVDAGNNIRLIGFITQAEPVMPLQNDDDVQLIGVYLPMSYMIGGFTVYVPHDRVKPIDISVEKAMRLTLTAGMAGDRGY